MKDNILTDKIRLAYVTGFCIILALPLLAVPPYFFPADFGKTIIFRSIMAILLFLFVFQFLFKRNDINLPNIKKNTIFWGLTGLFAVFLLASIFSVNPYFSFWSWPIRGGGFITFACYSMLAMVSFILFTKNDWKKVWDFSIFIGVLVSLVAVAQYYSLFSDILLPAPSRPSSTMGNPILLAIYLLLLFFLTLSLAIQEKKVWKKTSYGVSLALFFYVILITGSRSAYLGMLCGIIYFLLWYPIHSKQARDKTPKKIIFLKMAAAGLLAMALIMVFYVNTINQYPLWLQKNKLFNSVATRLSMKNLLTDARFPTLRIELDMVRSRPILGYGPENFSVGFDKNYKPTTAYFTGIISWWDRAHNIILQTASDAGILGLVSYLALFVALFWQLHKVKSAEKKAETQGLAQTENMPIAHGIQATLLGYFIANLFSFDAFGSYLIFFLLIGYSLHITSAATPSREEENRPQKKMILKSVCMCAFFFIVAIFLWQYNMVPLRINAQINKARSLADQKNCSGALNLMEKILPQKSFLDSYARLEYVDIAKTCADFYPQNNLGYERRGLELINQAVKIQPLYTRYWIFMANAANDVASVQKDASVKSNLIKEAYHYLGKALELAPNHQEIPILQARVAITAQDYSSAEHYARNCIALNPDSSECYFYLGLAQIYAKNGSEAQKNIQIASQGYSVYSKENLQQLSNAYGSVTDYPNLVLVYEKLTGQDPTIAQYHSSLAFFYKEVGRYKEARYEALKTLDLSPESKPNVEAFLKTLP